jgi:triacylglycerol lipase
MPRTSALARLQQALVLGLALAAGAWAVWRWDSSPIQATAGAALIVGGYALFLLAEFLIVWRVSRSDTLPPPTWPQLLSAWWAEVMQAPRIFGWRQPFRWRAEPDHLDGVHGRRGAVFIHGFVCNRGFWTPWLEQLRLAGHGFAAVNLEPVFGSIDRYPAVVEGAVRRVREATGLPPVLICHSMGGLAARAWLRSSQGDAGVHKVITIGSPHHGTWLARFSHLPNGRQMRQASPWLQQLERDEAGRPAVPFLCWYSNCDNIVFPASTAMRPGADNRLVPGIAHVDLAFHPEVMRASLAEVTGL